MKNYYLIFVLVLILFSCSNDKIKSSYEYRVVRTSATDSFLVIEPFELKVPVTQHPYYDMDCEKKDILGKDEFNHFLNRVSVRFAKLSPTYFDGHEEIETLSLWKVCVEEGKLQIPSSVKTLKIINDINLAEKLSKLQINRLVIDAFEKNISFVENSRIDTLQLDLLSDKFIEVKFDNTKINVLILTDSTYTYIDQLKKHNQLKKIIIYPKY